jgi:hypothetical protein
VWTSGNVPADNAPPAACAGQLPARGRGRHSQVLNLSWLLTGDPPDGTFYFNNEPNLLDQFLVNKNMATQNAPIRGLLTMGRVGLEPTPWD